jgi:GT2 family glycosyltransferase
VNHLTLLDKCLRTLHASADCDIVVVDDAGPLTGAAYVAAEAGHCDCITKEQNGGFSSAVNEGLRRALDEGRDAVLVNSDIEFTNDTWLDELQATDADVVGGLLLYPFNRVQSAGSYFSPLTRGWHHRYHWAPPDVAGVAEPAVCPCTAALQLISYDCLVGVGLYDEEYELAFEDVDYALRVFDHGMRCAYQPRSVATHHESATRGDGFKSDAERRSYHRLYLKYNDRDMSRFYWPAP